MRKPRFVSLAGLLAGACLLVSASVAGAAASPPAVPAGQTVNLDVPAGTPSQGTVQTFTFSYPGDGSGVLIDARISGLDAPNYSAAGFNVYDEENVNAPMETATTLTNQKDSVPGSIEFGYSSGHAGMVTVQFFNWSQEPLTLSLTPVSLPNGSSLQVVSASAGAGTAK